MSFHPIDLQTWDRREYFEHYMHTVPWLDFTAFDLTLYDSRRYTLPIFTLGKLQEADGRKTLPLAIQVHHAVCDGWHVNLYLEHLRRTIENNNWRKTR